MPPRRRASEVARAKDKQKMHAPVTSLALGGAPSALEMLLLYKVRRRCVCRIFCCRIFAVGVIRRSPCVLLDKARRVESAAAVAIVVVIVVAFVAFVI